MTAPSKREQLALIEALRQCLQSLEETTGHLVQLTLSLPEGPLRKQLLDEVSALDSIADAMRQALDAFGAPARHQQPDL